MSAGDRFSIVSFSNDGTVNQQLVVMDSEGASETHATRPPITH